MGLPDSQLQILAEIEKQLEADERLDAEFWVFASVTLTSGMPAAEQLETPDSVTRCRNSRRTGLRTFLGRLVMVIMGIVAGLVITLATLLVAMSGSGPARCEPAGAASRVNHATTCAQSGSGGHLNLPRSSSRASQP